MKLLEELDSTPVQTLQLILLFYGQKNEQKDIGISGKWSKMQSKEQLQRAQKKKTKKNTHTHKTTKGHLVRAGKQPLTFSSSMKHKLQRSSLW